ncbi:26S proteasome non-ATPase regulatory subunit [Fasciola hepatica]|uniref:26S proteasome non-ATPase regulatory subunit n=1 Tax=Fasciola hepatica TaxID=6192 RepID=A0A4E0R1C7_FASHE|nr:26S proteasome non-ATPase regulatory subunit [Fasciola hepatica]
MPVEPWQLAFEGKFKELSHMIDSDPKVIQKTDKTGRNLLHWAACGGHLELFKVLLSKGLDKDSCDNSQWTPLMIAVSAGRESLVEYLIDEVQADVNVINSTGQCPLHYAASKNRLKIAEMLLDAKASAAVQDWGGTTPLHRAIAQENLDMAKLLLERCPSSLVSLADKEGYTPLHYACEEQNMSAVRLLLEHGASATVQGKDGKTPLDVAPDTFSAKVSKYIKGLDSS